MTPCEDAARRPAPTLLHFEETLCAVDKPAGMLVHNSAWAGKREPSVRQVLGARLGRPAYPLHRLDRQTSGVLLFSLRKELVEPWRQRLIAGQKTYLALVRGRNLAPQVLDHPVKDAKKVRKSACTEVVAVWPSPVERCSLVCLRPKTGRTHQIRQHLKHLNHPIWQDATYGDLKENRRVKAAFGPTRLCLHAWRVELVGLDDEERSVSAPLAEDLAALLSALQIPAPSWPPAGPAPSAPGSRSP